MHLKKKEKTMIDIKQFERIKDLWGQVVLAALDDAINDNRKQAGRGTDYLIRWMRSADGRFVMTNAGIEPCQRTWDGMVEYVKKDVLTSNFTSQKSKTKQAKRKKGPHRRKKGDGGL